ncbi:hypothetical protein ACOME3_008609 [Neoechinorhynchus agilis]
MEDTVKDMISNMFDSPIKYGFVPECGRVYYITRSQPSVFTLMVNDFYERTLKDLKNRHRTNGEIVRLLGKEPVLSIVRGWNLLTYDGRSHSQNSLFEIYRKEFTVLFVFLSLTKEPIFKTFCG